MKQVEKTLENKCKRQARLHGWVSWKNEKNGHKGIPDDSFLSEDGTKFLLIEFKKSPKIAPRPEQQVWLDKFPLTAYLIGSYEEFCRLLGIPE